MKSRADEINIGDKFGHLTVIEKIGARITCQCECGNKRTLYASELLKGNTSACSCRCDLFRLDKIEKLAGKCFGNIFVIKDYLTDKFHMCECICNCGGVFNIRARTLKAGKATMCKSCYRKKYKHGLKHGLVGTRFYRIWLGMGQRCTNPKTSSYDNYGGRGISVEWSTFEEFKVDMYESYLKHVEEFGENDTTLDRINFNGDYCKENCRWVTQREQQANKRTNILIKDKNDLNGIYCLSTYCEKYNLPYQRVYKQIKYGDKNVYDVLREFGDSNFVEE